MTLAARPDPAPPAVAETASTAMAAAAKAAIEARCIMAMRNPRSWDQVRVKLLEACKRPKFAETARYAKPIGNSKVVGPSIRFAEEAMRQMGNIMAETRILFDDQDRRIVLAAVMDLERNLTYPQEIILQKTVERRFLAKGQTAISSRTNKTGQVVHLVEASEDDLLVKQNAQISKALRTSALRILPSDILEECMTQVITTVQNEDAKDPAAAKKRILDAFYELGVAPKDLEAFLGHGLEQVTPAELQLLWATYTAIKEGEATWQDVMASKEGGNGEAQPAKPAGRSESLEELAERKRKELELQQKGPPPPAPDTPAPPAADDLTLDQEIAEEDSGRRKKR